MIARYRPGISRTHLALLLGGGVLVMVLAVFGAQVWRYYGVIRSGGDVGGLADLQFNDRFTAGTATTTAPQDADVQRAAAFSADDPTIGNAGAPVTVTEFADFGCPFSRDESFIIREIAAKYPDVVRFQFRDFPIEELHPGATRAAEAGACANAQGKFWAMHDKLFQNQGNLKPEDLKRYAVESGLDAKVFASCLDRGTFKTKVENDIAVGSAAGVSGTPTFFVNGFKIDGAIPADAWEKIVSLVKQK
jgi:protein-disulfide isomerase